MAARYLGTKAYILAGNEGKVTSEFMKPWYSISDKLSKSVYEDVETGELMVPVEEDYTDTELEIISLAKSLDGVFLNYGQHAAGTIIASRDVSDVLPLMKNDKKKNMETQCTMAQAEAKGFLKMDFLNLINLDIITQIERLTGDTKVQTIEGRQEILKDKRVYKEIFSAGLTHGIFQFESPGMKKMLMEFEPGSFEDLILLVAAYRPGPMDYLPEIISQKQYKDGKIAEPLPATIQIKNPILDSILAPTYGCPIYQEQIMQIFGKMAGYSLGQADLVRRAMSKKHLEELVIEKDAFIYGDEKRGIPGCMKLAGITEAQADELFEQMKPFARYGFNKSHAAAYALTAFFTAYLKLYHPAEFFAVSLNHTAKTEEVTDFVKEMKKFHIPLFRPDVLRSHALCTVEGNGVRFGLSLIKGIGNIKVTGVINPAEFLYINDVKPSSAEKIALVGGFDDFCSNRKKIADWIKTYGKKIKNAQKEEKEIPVEILKALWVQTNDSFDVIETRRIEMDSLGAVLSVEDSMKKIQINEGDFSLLYCGDIGEVRVPAVVLGCSEKKLTKTSKKPYYEVTLMDKNQEIITRRFDRPVTCAEGSFLLTTEENKYFICKYNNIQPLQKNQYYAPRLLKESETQKLYQANGNAVLSHSILHIPTTVQKIKEWEKETGEECMEDWER